MNRAVGYSKLVWLRLRTWLVVVFLVTLGIILGSFGGGFLGIFVAILLIRYLERQDQKMIDLQWQYNIGKVGRLGQQIDDGLAALTNMTLQARIRVTYYGLDGRLPAMCRTCQSTHSPWYFDDIHECNNLRDVFPHDPHAEPPPNNPFEWLWFTQNGYRMPPDDWPKDKPWLPLTAIDPDCVTAMTEEGRVYYETHPNPLWDAGFGNPPEWYIPKCKVA